MPDSGLLRSLLPEILLATAVAAAAAVTTLETLQVFSLYNRGLIEAGEWWRLLTGNFAHLNLRHLLLDLVAWILIFLLGRAWLSIADWIVCLVVCCLTVSAGLYWFSPEIGVFGGLSGALHGLFALMALKQLRAGDRLGWLLLLLVTVKLLYEGRYGGTPGTSELIGVPVAAQTHLYGALGGAALFPLLLLADRLRKGTRRIRAQ
ncbi:MAG: rhombosortase [Gammaproteobacteria bacterium]|nr:rhombosortase [Gammaproteobacteria bacterium]